MSFLSFRKKEPEINGIIKYLNLVEFWRSCTAEEQNALIRYHQSGLGFRGSPIAGTISVSSNTPHKYLSAMLGWATTEKNYALAEKLIAAGRQVPINYQDCEDAHFFYQEAAECYYKQRDFNPAALRLSEELCEKDLALFPYYAPQMISKYGSIPRIVTIKRLITIYDKSNRIPEAIELCKTALRYELDDGTKGGYPALLKRLEKKA
jgi:tetratricopeptide (TPR) repeat protein